MRNTKVERVVSAQVTPEMWDKINELMKKEQRTRSNLLRIILEEGLKKWQTNDKTV